MIYLFLVFINLIFLQSWAIEEKCRQIARQRALEIPNFTKKDKALQRALEESLYEDCLKQQSAKYTESIEEKCKQEAHQKALEIPNFAKKDKDLQRVLEESLYEDCLRQYKSKNKNKEEEKVKNESKQNHQPSSIWQSIIKSKLDDISKDEKVRYFIDDCKKLESENSKIPQHIKNDKTVRIATYNVHEWRSVYFEKNFDDIFKVIKNINPDIIVLQEAIVDLSSFWVNVKENFEKEGYKFSDFIQTMPSLGSLGGGFGNAIFSKYKFLQKEHTVFEIDKDKKEKRAFVKTLIELPNKKSISVYGTHLDVYDDKEDSRLAEIKELLKTIKERDKSENILIAADFNSVRVKDYQYKINDILVWDILSRANKKRIGIDTPTKALDEIFKSDFTDCFEKAKIEAPKFTVWTGTVVDFLFLNKTWNLPIAGCYVYYSSASDHIPVFMDVKVS